jgi:hypothetical protein
LGLKSLSIFSKIDYLYKAEKAPITMEKDIGKIKKNAQTDIVVRIDDFGGKPGLTIREFTNSETYKGFTKSGTRIPAESFQQFKEMINSIDDSTFSSSSSSPNTKPSPKKEEKDNIEDIPEEDLL